MSEYKGTLQYVYIYTTYIHYTLHTPFPRADSPESLAGISALRTGWTAGYCIRIYTCIGL